MYSIDSDVTNEYVINKSKFITKLYYVDNVEEVASVLNKVKSEYSLANHYCYAYIINNISKSSDDKEPSGTAGIPILNVLLKNNLNNILCIVVRYFGGIKLGAGGLVRAYTNSVSSALLQSALFSAVFNSIDEYAPSTYIEWSIAYAWDISLFM